jgi:hypothetical protein
MKKIRRSKKELLFWKVLTNFWATITSIVFLTTFFNIYDLSHILTSVSVTYITILSIFVGVKEFNRWHHKKDFLSRYTGEIFILSWTLLMVIFIFVSAGNPEYKVYSQFTSTYLSVLGLFAISRKSKNLRLK